MNNPNGKEEIFNNICHTVLKLEMQKGHLQWTMSDLARVSKVGRPLIYYYFGKDKAVILQEAWKMMIDTIFCLSTSESLGIQERIRQTIQKVNEMPFLFVLFFLEKNADSEIGQIIRKGEADLLALLKQNYKQYSQEDILEIILKSLARWLIAL